MNDLERWVILANAVMACHGANSAAVRAEKAAAVRRKWRRCISIS